MRVTENCLILVHHNRLNWMAEMAIDFEHAADQDRQPYDLLSVTKDNDCFFLNTKGTKFIWSVINLNSSHSIPLA